MKKKQHLSQIVCEVFSVLFKHFRVSLIFFSVYFFFFCVFYVCVFVGFIIWVDFNFLVTK